MVSASLLASALVVLGPNGPATPLATAKSMAQAYTKAVQAKNLNWLVANTTADFTFVTAKGVTEDKARALADIKSGFSGMKSSPTVKVDVISARRVEGGVLAVQNSSLSAKVDFGKPRPSTIVSKTREEVLYVPKGKGWQMKRIKILRDATLIDGKAFGSS